MNCMNKKNEYAPIFFLFSYSATALYCYSCFCCSYGCKFGFKVAFNLMKRTFWDFDFAIFSCVSRIDLKTFQSNLLSSTNLCACVHFVCWFFIGKKLCQFIKKNTYTHTITHTQWLNCSHSQSLRLKIQFEIQFIFSFSRINKIYLNFSSRSCFYSWSLSLCLPNLWQEIDVSMAGCVCV